MLIPANAASENQQVIRFVDKNYTKINRLCQFLWERVASSALKGEPNLQI